MFCTNCGSKLPDGARFCTSCGAPVAPMPQPSASQRLQPAAPQQQQSQQPQQPKKSNKKLYGIIGGAAVVVIGLCLLLFTGGGSGKPAGHGEQRQMDEPAKSVTEMPKASSKAFRVETIEGVTISAPKDALDHDREFKVTPVDEKEWQKAEKKVAELSGGSMLFCLNMDSGQIPGDHFPGVFTTQIDLKKLGIPPALYDYMGMYHFVGDDVERMTTWVENDKLTFNSDRNGSWAAFLAIPSAKVAAVTGAVALVVVGAVAYIGETWHKHHTTGDLYKNFFMMNNDAVAYPIKDKYGDFTLYFRFKDTEWEDGYESFVNNSRWYEERLGVLVKEADAEYEAEVDKKYKEELKDMNVWQKLVNSKAAYNRSKEAVDKGAILVRKMNADSDLQKYKKRMAPPPSIQDIEEMLKLSNRYLTDNQKLKPQTCNLEVDLVDSKHLAASAEYRRTVTKLPYMVVNYERIWGSEKGNYNRKGRGESLLLSLNHELFHHREKTHNWPKWMDYRSEETLASYNENAAAWYFLNKGEMTTNIFEKEGSSKKKAEGIDPSPRDNYEVFAYPFEKKFTSFGSGAESSYTYADFMDSLQIYKGLGEHGYLRGDHVIGNYGYFSTHKSNYMTWFSIKDEKQFDNYYKRFCENSFPKIFDRLISAVVTAEAPELSAPTYTVSTDKPVVEVPLVDGELLMRCFWLDRPRKEPNFNAFVVRGEDCPKENVSVIWSLDDYNVVHKGQDYLNDEAGQYRCGYFKTSEDATKFQIVALFKPDVPKITKMAKDKFKFKLPKAPKALLSKGLISGVVVTLTDIATGQKDSMTISVKKLDKDPVFSKAGIHERDFSLSFHWVYKPDKKFYYKSPESDAITNKGKEIKAKEKKEPDVEEKKGYWQQISARGIVENARENIDINEGEVVEEDSRAVEIKLDEDNELVILGVSTIKKKKNREEIFVQQVSLDGYVSYTEPPKKWRANERYSCQWYTDRDPFVASMDKPFTFKVENASTEPKACKMGSDQMDWKDSKVAAARWLYRVNTDFLTANPGKDGPKSFVLTQKYTLTDPSSRDMKSAYVLTYEYKWVEGEIEDEVSEEEEFVKEYVPEERFRAFRVSLSTRMFDNFDSAEYKKTIGQQGLATYPRSMTQVFEFEKGEVTTRPVGPDDYLITCRASVNNLVENKEGTYNQTATLTFHFHKRADLGENSMGMKMTGYRLTDGTFSISRQKVIDAGREHYDYQQERWIYYRYIENASASGSFKEMPSRYNSGSGYDFKFFCIPDSYTMTSKFKMWQGDNLVPTSTTQTEAQARAHFDDLKAKSEANKNTVYDLDEKSVTIYVSGDYKYEQGETD